MATVRDILPRHPNGGVNIVFAGNGRYEKPDKDAIEKHKRRNRLEDERLMRRLEKEMEL